MDNFFVLIGVAVGALLLGILFIKYYNRIDKYFFGRTKCVVPTIRNGQPTLGVVTKETDYEPFGRTQILICAFCGALLGGIIIATSFRIDYDSAKYLTLAIALIVVSTLSYNLYEAIARMTSFGACVGKVLFLTVTCVIGFGCGVLGSALVCLAIMIYIIILAMCLAISKADNRIVVKKTGSGLFGEQYYKEVDGSRKFEKIGTGVREI